MSTESDAQLESLRGISDGEIKGNYLSKQARTERSRRKKERKEKPCKTEASAKLNYQ
jgi:hypothetical protein